MQYEENSLAQLLKHLTGTALEISNFNQNLLEYYKKKCMMSIIHQTLII